MIELDVTSANVSRQFFFKIGGARCMAACACWRAMVRVSGAHVCAAARQCAREAFDGACVVCVACACRCIENNR